MNPIHKENQNEFGKSEAIRFAKWLIDKCIVQSGDCNKYYLEDRLTTNTIEELYQEYKNEPTKERR